ncbi:MAG: tetratricopeptide repeat protein, partial [Chloroflexi bacterium]|nr:tetratricopeptide repeat protein [Chloroflexota bacterium]
MADYLVARGALHEAEQLLTVTTGRARDRRSQSAIAERWLRLGRAWRAGGSVDGAEAAMRRANELGSGPEAGTALAQLLQRQGRTEEAIAQWRDVIRRAPDSVQARVALAEQYLHNQDAPAAGATYLELSQAVPTMSAQLLAAERLQELTQVLPPIGPERTVRIAMLGNATMDQLADYLTVEAFRNGLRPTVHKAGYDQYSQQILNGDSDLYRFDPDVIVLAIHSSRLLPRLHAFPFDLPVEQRQRELDEGIQIVERLVDRLAERTSAMILVHNLVSPQFPALGLLDNRDEFGQRAAIAEFNRRLAELVRTRYRSAYVIDEDAVQSQFGKANASDARMWFTARLP